MLAALLLNLPVAPPVPIVESPKGGGGGLTFGPGAFGTGRIQTTSRDSEIADEEIKRAERKALKEIEALKPVVPPAQPIAPRALPVPVLKTDQSDTIQNLEQAVRQALDAAGEMASDAIEAAREEARLKVERAEAARIAADKIEAERQEVLAQERTLIYAALMTALLADDD